MTKSYEAEREVSLHACEWCEDIAIWQIRTDDGKYERYACGKHNSKNERLADLDLGKNVSRWHRFKTQGFPIQKETITIIAEGE